MKTILILLTAIVALTSIPSGIMMMIRPDGALLQLDIAILHDTPFRNFFIPGMALSLIAGGSNLLACILNLKKHASRYDWSIVAGLMIGGWITVQIILIGLLHGLQIFYIAAAAFIILIAYQLKGKWAA